MVQRLFILFTLVSLSFQAQAVAFVSPKVFELVDLHQKKVGTIECTSRVSIETLVHLKEISEESAVKSVSVNSERVEIDYQQNQEEKKEIVNLAQTDCGFTTN